MAGGAVRVMNEVREAYGVVIPPFCRCAAAARLAKCRVTRQVPKCTKVSSGTKTHEASSCRDYLECEVDEDTRSPRLLLSLHPLSKHKGDASRTASIPV